MPYFTSWDANLYLCLMSLGLPHDISLAMVGWAKKVHKDYCLEESRSYYLDRGEWMENTWMVTDRDRVSAVRFGKEFNMRAIVDISCIPFFFWNNLGKMNFEYEDSIKKIEPEERNEYFEWAYENHYHGWDNSILEWAKGFHPGRWILMDKKRGETLEDIRELEDYGAYTEERFIRSKNHIDELLNR